MRAAAWWSGFARGRPGLEILPRWKPRAAFSVYGESAVVAIGCGRADGYFDRILGVLAGALAHLSAWTGDGIHEEPDGSLLIHANGSRPDA